MLRQQRIVIPVVFADPFTKLAVCRGAAETFDPAVLVRRHGLRSKLPANPRELLRQDDAPSRVRECQRSGNAAQLKVAYDKRIPFLYNIDFLLHFEKSVTLQGNVGE